MLTFIINLYRFSKFYYISVTYFIKNNMYILKLNGFYIMYISFQYGSVKINLRIIKFNTFLMHSTSTYLSSKCNYLRTENI